MPAAANALQLILRQQTPAISQAAQQNARNPTQPLSEKQRAALHLTQQALTAARATAKSATGASGPTPAATGASTPRRVATVTAVKAPPSAHRCMNRGSKPRRERAFAIPDTRGEGDLSAAPTTAQSLFARLDDSDEEATMVVLANVDPRINLGGDASAWVLQAAGRRPIPLLSSAGDDALANTPAAARSINDGECDDEVATIRNRTSRKRLRTLPQLDTSDALVFAAGGVSGAVALDSKLLTMAPSRLRCLGEESDESDEAAPPPLTPPCVRRPGLLTASKELTDPKEPVTGVMLISTAANKKARIDADADAAAPPGVVRSVHIRGPIVMSETHLRAPVCRTLLQADAASSRHMYQARPAAAPGN